MKSENPVKTGWFFWYLIWGFLILFTSFWLYLHESNDMQMLSVRVVPQATEFTIEVLGEGKHFKLVTVDDRVSYVMEQKRTEEGVLLEVTGKVSGSDIGEAQGFVLISEADREHGKWSIEKVEGGILGVPNITGIVNETSGIYFLVAGLVILIVFLMRFRYVRCPGAYLGVDEVLSRVRQSEYGKVAWESGKKHFIWYTRICDWLLLAFEALMIALGFGMLQLMYYNMMFFKKWPDRKLLPCFLTIAAVLFLLMIICIEKHRKAFLSILTTELCPLSASVAFGLEATQGFLKASKKKDYILLSATALCRAGWYEEALDLEEMLPEIIPARRNALNTLLRLNLRMTCQRQLGRLGEMEMDRGLYKEILEKNPGLRKNDNIRQMALTQKLIKATEELNVDKSEAYFEEIMEHYPEPYSRLPSMLKMLRLYEQVGDHGKMEPIITQVLQFSPQNNEVQELLAYGTCTYKNTAPVLIRRFVKYVTTAVSITAGVILVCLCVNVSLISRRAENTIISSGILLPEREEKEAETEQESNMVLHTTEEVSQETGSGNAETKDTVNTAEYAPFTLKYPESWSGLYVEEPLENGGIAVYQKSSKESMGDGSLFAISVMKDGDYRNLPDYEIWGYDSGYAYVLIRPTDVTFDMEDLAVTDEYNSMCQDISLIRASFEIQSETARYDGGEFIFPNSDCIYLNESDLLNLSEKELRIAKNEIYARRGRRFKDESLNQYFKGKAWYRGTIDPDDFIGDMLNDYEQANVILIQEYQDRLLNP